VRPSLVSARVRTDARSAPVDGARSPLRSGRSGRRVAVSPPHRDIREDIVEQSRGCAVHAPLGTVARGEVVHELTRPRSTLENEYHASTVGTGAAVTRRVAPRAGSR